MAVNAPLLRQTLAQIEQHPEAWHQARYRCGTGMCFAGWAAQLDGGTWRVSDPDHMFADYLVADEGDVVTRIVVGVESVDTPIRAARVLGLTPEDADELFEGGNDLHDIREIVARLVASVHHVTIRLVPDNERVIDETIAGRAPLEVIEHKSGQRPFTYGTELGIAREDLRGYAEGLAKQLGVPYIHPIPEDVQALLAEAGA